MSFSIYVPAFATFIYITWFTCHIHVLGKGTPYNIANYRSAYYDSLFIYNFPKTIIFNECKSVNKGHCIVILRLYDYFATIVGIAINVLAMFADFLYYFHNPILPFLFGLPAPGGVHIQKKRGAKLFARSTS